MTVANHSEKITRLRVLLAKKGISQKELAEMSGLETYQVSQICSGKKTNITLTTAKRIAYSLDVSLDEAFGDDMDETDN